MIEEEKEIGLMVSVMFTGFWAETVICPEFLQVFRECLLSYKEFVVGIPLANWLYIITTGGHLGKGGANKELCVIY